MCLLIVKPAGVEIPFSTLTNAALANPHGAGIAWSDGDACHIAKNAKWSGEEVARELERLRDFPALIHFRYATHGSRSNANAHPFELPAGYAAAHNGVIHGVKCKGDESDTRAFLRLHVAPLLEKGAALHDAAHIAKLEKLHGGGNKMAFLSPGGRYSITNESAGTWKGGAWLSNLHHEWREEETAGSWQSWGDYERGSSRKSKGSRYAAPCQDADLVEIRDAGNLLCDYCGGRIRGEFGLYDDASFACMDCASYLSPLGTKSDSWPF